MIRESFASLVRRRLRALFAPEVRLVVWEVSKDRRSNAQRDRDLESTWRSRVRMNERQRELERIRRDKFRIRDPYEALVEFYTPKSQARSPVAIPEIRFTRRQAK